MRGLARCAAAIVALLGAVCTCSAQTEVNYQCLAKPLSEVLADVSLLLGKKVTCTPEVAGDRICVYVTNVSPRDLLDRITQCVAGVVTEQDGTLTVSADHAREERAYAEILERLPRQVAEWRAEASGSKIRAIGSDIDMTAFAEFVTVELIKRTPFGGYLHFSKPQRWDAQALPPAFPDYHASAISKFYTFVGTSVGIQFDRSGVTATLLYVNSDGLEYRVYWKHFPREESARSELLGKHVALSGALAARNRLLSESANAWTSSPRSLIDLDAFSGRPWGTEPLNALLAPAIHAFAQTEGIDCVVYLDDRAMSLTLPTPIAIRNFCAYGEPKVYDQWLVVAPFNPGESRRMRFDRARFEAFAARARARGYFDFWECVDYANAPGYAGDGSLRAEAAAMGPVSLALFDGMTRPVGTRLLEGLRLQKALWQRLDAGQAVDVYELPAELRAQLLKSLVGPRIVTRTVTTYYDDNGVRTARKTEEPVSISAARLEKGFPQRSSITLNKSTFIQLIAVNAERKYGMAFSTADFLSAATAVDRTERTDAIAAMRRFVPVRFRQCSIKVQVNEFSIPGSYYRWIEPVDGVHVRPFLELPLEWQKGGSMRERG